MGGTGYGEAKKRLAELLIEYFAPYRQKRMELGEDIGYVRRCFQKEPDGPRQLQLKRWQK